MLQPATIPGAPLILRYRSKEVVDGHGVSWDLGAGVSLFKGSQCGFVSIPTRILSISCGPACLSNPSQCAMTAIGPGSVSLSRSTNRNFQITKGEI